MEEEFKAMKVIMDALTRNWPLLAPDTRLWLKKRLESLPTDQVPVDDVERERT